MSVPLHQKTRTHQPQNKVVEFLVAILAGLPGHLEDLSHNITAIETRSGCGDCLAAGPLGRLLVALGAPYKRSPNRKQSGFTAD